MKLRRFAFVLLITTSLVLSLLGPALASPPSPVNVAQTTPAPNPDVAEQCGLPVTLVLDASGSIQTANAVELIRDAAEAFLDAVKDTGSTARVVDFGTFSRQTAGAELVTTDSMAAGGVHAEAIAAYYNPRPPVTAPATEARQYDGSGPLTSASNFGNPDNNNDQWTNWDSALDRANDNSGELVVFVTDGDPTAIDLNQPGDPSFPTAPAGTTVAFNTFRGSGTGPSVDRAVQEANTIKNSARILAVGVGAAVTQPASVQRLVQIAGPDVVTDEDIGDVESINDVDVAVVQNFADLKALLRGVVTQLCSPSLAVRKFVQSAESTNYIPGEDWSIEVDPGVEGDFRWIQPAVPGMDPETRQTNADGFANFQWEPDPPDQNSNAVITEELEDDFVGGPATCEILHPNGDVEFIDYDDSSLPLDVPMGPEDIVTCTLNNNFDYDPGINLVKTASEETVRGDNGGTSVTYTGIVTNTGNTPLVLSEGDDDRCTEVEFVGGDDNDDGKLDLNEEWEYQCTRVLAAGLSTEEILEENTAFVVGVDPAGTEVDDEDTEVVEIITPAINLEKVASAEQVAPGTDVTYTFTVTNEGNDPLSDITLEDSNPGCVPVLDSGDNGDGILDLDETWVYSCTVAIDDDTTNLATVTGTPSIGDDVDDPATASVDVVHDDMNLDKTASADFVAVGDEVTYTYVLSSPADSDPLEPPEGVTRETAVTDDSCEPVEFVSDSGNDDQILDPGEAWTYECTTVITELTLNISTATMVGPLGPITREDQAVVIPLPAGINIVKSASDDLVPAGTDITYTYEVTNTGEAPLANVADGVSDDFCSPVSFVDGDGNGDDLLDPGELWTFTCTATLNEDTVNTATVSGNPVIAGEERTPVTDEDTAEVDVFTAGIELVKTASEDLVRVGTRVTFTFVATNTGDISLVPLGITDDQCSPLEFIGGDPEGDGAMAPGEAWTWECSKEMQADTVNTAVIEASDPTGEVVTDEDDAEVTVFDSAIDLEKTAAPELVPQGANTTFTLTVTNPGPAPLSDITITDDTCTGITFVGGDTNGDDVLQVGETWTYTCSMPIDRATVNTATVTGTDPGGGKPTDTGVAGAIPYNPSLEVVKTVEPFQVQPGGSVTYTYAVTNTGDVPLAGVRGSITDDTCSPVSYVSGDVNNNGLLDGDIDATPVFEYTSTVETWIFTCTTTVEEDTVNVVTVTGTPTDPRGNPIGPDVSADDEAEVEVIDELPATGVVPIWMALAALLAAIGALILVRNRRRLGAR